MKIDWLWRKCFGVALDAPVMAPDTGCMDAWLEVVVMTYDRLQRELDQLDAKLSAALDRRDGVVGALVRCTACGPEYMALQNQLDVIKMEVRTFENNMRKIRVEMNGMVAIKANIEICKMV
jgi:hypothetical protein